MKECGENAKFSPRQHPTPGDQEGPWEQQPFNSKVNDARNSETTQPVQKLNMEANKDERVRKVDQDGGDLELEPAKRQKSCDIDDCVQVETVEEDETGVAPVSDVKQSEQRELMCILCMEEGSVESPLLSEHQCAQCNKDAWKICACCNETILSRTCPVCRGNYAPILLHVVPGNVCLKSSRRFVLQRT